MRGFRRASVVACIWLALACMAVAGPPLTTIEDVLYKADGTRFTGIAYIEWRQFTASDSSYIAPNSTSVQIIAGVLKLQLVPTVTSPGGAYYLVRYYSDGRQQFTESWAVPPSLTPLRVTDVRISASGAQGGGSTSGGSAGGLTAPIAITDVTGLSTELSARPTRGPGFLASRVAFINPSGSFDGVTGSLTDCVRVDGTTGPCGGSSGPGFIDSETPAGLIDGSNQMFSLANIPSPPESLSLYRNGLFMKNGFDYTISGVTITFVTGATPQAGDVLLASYRLADPGNPTGAAGGSLTGNYPNPLIAASAVSNLQIAAGAGIAESKLALNYPTHSSANDPTAGEKLALTGTVGTPSSSNRYVTDQDTRLTNARTPLGHSLLGTGHSDTTAATVARGDLIVGLGSSPTTWTRLPIGQANRCLMSNGSDAVWNTCLFTGYSSGSIPYVDTFGNLAQNNARLFWENGNRRLGIGTNTPASTVYVHDSLAVTGSTELTVRAGQGQGTSPMQRWLDASAVEVARVEVDGAFVTPAIRTSSSTLRAAWKDSGTPSDPTARVNGDAWFNTTQQSRKTLEASQIHTVPQVICSNTGASTASTALTRLASCTIPTGYLSAGDRVEIQADYTHQGSGTGFSIEVRWGSTVLVARSAAGTDSGMAVRAAAGVHASGASWSVQSWGATSPLAASLGNSPISTSPGLTIDFLGSMAMSGAESIAIQNVTVVRYPAQANP